MPLYPRQLFSNDEIGREIMKALIGLGFIGLVERAPLLKWGAMLSVARGYMPNWWRYGLFYGIVIYLIILGFNMIGDRLNHILDQRTSAI